MKNLILVRGIPGSGKTTFAKIISPWNIAADDCWAYDYTVDPRGFNFEESQKAHQRCQECVQAWMEINRTPIVVHNTFVSLNSMLPYFTLARAYGYQTHTLVIENRHMSESIHNVPNETLNKMKNNFEITL